MSVNFGALSAPFPPARVSWRVGTTNKKKRQRETGNNQAKATKGQALAYLDARDVMERFDEVCGPGGWQNRYTHADKKTVCEIGVRVGDEWVWKSDGAGDSDIEAEKGALSDAFKRAAVRWGVGRYLYDVESPWVELDDWEQIKDSEKARLCKLLPGSRVAPSKSEPEPQADTDKLSGACELAIGFITRCASRAELRELWTKNKAGWNAAFTEAEKAAITAARDETAAKLPEEKEAA